MVNDLFVQMVTENEAKLCSVQKELQLKLDMMTFDLQRKGGGDTSVQGLSEYMMRDTIINCMV